ncbi:MAG: histidine kinase dimerization/phosphoacceptor domain -containing protein [Geminicoccaceae bacterium]
MGLLARLYLLVILVVLPAIAIPVLNEVWLRQDSKAQMRGEALRLAAMLASELDGLHEDAQALATLVAETPELRAGDWAGCERLLDRLARGVAREMALSVQDHAGHRLCGRERAAGDPARPALAASLPLTDASGAATGTVEAAVDLDRLRQRLAARPLPADAWLELVDRSGRTVLALPDATRAGQPARPELLPYLAASAADTQTSRPPGAAPMVVAYLPPDAEAGRELLVAVALPAGNATAGVRSATHRSVLLIGLGLVVALVLARLAGRVFLLDPVDRLLQAAERWRTGDLTARARLGERAGELSRLGEAFDAMAERIEARELGMRDALAALRASNARFEEFVANAQSVLWVCDPQGCRVEFVSPAYAAFWSRDPAALTREDDPFGQAVHPEDRTLVADGLRAMLSGAEISLAYRLILPESGLRWVRDSSFPIRDAHGAVVRIGGICRDVTELKQIEEEREASLREREGMLREINHRVKNNLQVIISLLRLQAHRGQSDEVRMAFEQACSRVSTITELHVALFNGVQIGTIDFGAYLHDLCARLETTGSSWQEHAFKIVVEAASEEIDLDRAIPLGLIVNELVSNAIRHAFADGRPGTITVRFTRAGERFRLGVADDGVGATMPAAGAPQGLGLQLINGFVRRLRGRLELPAGPGFEVVVDFPVEVERQRSAAA